MQPSSMIRQPNSKERGLHKKSLKKIQHNGSAMRMLPISPHWTVVEGRIEVRSFITRRDDNWKKRGFTDPVATQTLNVHGNEDTYFCGFPGQGQRSKSNHHDHKKLKYKPPMTKIIQACMGCQWNKVMSLLQETPLRAEQRTANNCYPLHLCLMRNAPESVITFLIELYPEAAKQATKKRRALPLHLACESQHAIGRIVLMVADVYHGAAKKRLKPKYEWALPLHQALARGLPDIDGGSGSLSGVRSSNDTTTHKIMTSEDWGAVLAILKVNPPASRKKYRAKLPLEWAAWMQAPLGVLQALFNASHSKSILEALRGHVWQSCMQILNNKTSGLERAKGERTAMNQYPLHVAIEEKAPIHVVRLLLELYPKAAGRRAKFSFWVLGTQKRKGRWRSPVSTLVGNKELMYHAHMPIHTAAAVGASKEVIDALAEYNPQAFAARARGLLPLHIALQHRATSETIQALLEHHPQASFLRTETSLKNAQSALHLAMIHDAPVDVVTLLLAAYPGAVDEVDAWGHRPVHYGLSAHSSLHVVRSLLAKDGHHADDSLRKVALAYQAKVRQEAAVEGDKGIADGVNSGEEMEEERGEGKVKQHEHQYWNKPWNHQAKMRAQKRGKWKKKVTPQKEEDNAPEESEEESSSGSSSSGSSGSSGSSSSGSGSSEDGSDSDEDV